MNPSLKFLFALVINLFFMNSGNSQSYIYMLTQQERISFNSLLKKCFVDTISIQDKLTFWEIVNNHGGEPKDIKEVGDLRSLDHIKMNEYMRLFYEDALISINTKQPIKSNRRKELESDFDPKYTDLFKKNDAMMLQIALGNPVVNEGNSVLFNQETISEVLMKLDVTYKLLDYNLCFLETPLKTREREYLMNCKKFSSESKFEIAINWIDSAISLNPKNGSYYYLRGQNNFELGFLDDALNDFNKSISLDSLNYDVYNFKGLTLIKNGNSKEAIISFKQSIKLNSNRNMAFNNLGEVFFEEEQYNDAISYYNLALQHGYNAYTFYNLGLAQYFYNQDYVQVIKDMDSALSLDNTIIDAYYNRGLCYSHLKNYEKALSDFNTTLKMSENHENALINRGIVFANLKQFDNSCKDFKKAHSLGSTLAKPYMDKVCN